MIAAAAAVTDRLTMPAAPLPSVCVAFCSLSLPAPLCPLLLLEPANWDSAELVIGTVTVKVTVTRHSHSHAS